MGDRALLGERLVLALNPPAPGVARRHLGWWEEPEVDVHGLERAPAPGRLFGEVAAGDVIDQCTEGRRRRRRAEFAPEPLRGRKASRQQTNGCALDITFHPRHLAG